MINAFLKEAEKHVVAWSSNLMATYAGKHIFNVMASEDIDNGKLVNLDAMVWQDNEYFNMVAPTATSRVGLILSDPVGPDETPYAQTLESNFYNGNGEIMRVYDLVEGDRFEISANGIDVSAKAAAKGVYVVASGYDIVTSASTTEPTNAFVGQIVDIEKKTGTTFYKVAVRKNG